MQVENCRYSQYFHSEHGLCEHGLLEHSSIYISHVSPVNPSAQLSFPVIHKVGNVVNFASPKFANK